MTSGSGGAVEAHRAAADALAEVRAATKARRAAKERQLAAVRAAKDTPGVTVDAIAAETGMTRDGVYKMLR